MEEQTKQENGDGAEGTVSTTTRVSMEGPKTEVSASTIGRMMGLATVSDLKLLDSKVDLLSTKISSMTVKIDRALTILGSAPTGSDLERIDIQVGSLKNLIREALEALKDPSAK